MSDVVVVRVSASSGEVTLAAAPAGLPAGVRERVVYDPDRLLSTRELCRLLGIAEQTWRNYVNKGYAPAADDPGDLSKDARGRVRRWKASTVAAYRLNRKRQAWKLPK